MQGIFKYQVIIKSDYLWAIYMTVICALFERKVKEIVFYLRICFLVDKIAFNSNVSFQMLLGGKNINFTMKEMKPTVCHEAD